MAIELNDNIYSKVNRPTDFRFGPFVSIAQANTTIPIAQRYHGLIFGIYTDPLDIANSDIDYFYYYDGLTDVDYKPFGGQIISGTTNYVSKFNVTGDNVEDSRIFDNGTNVGIGTTDFTDPAPLVISGRVSQVDLSNSTYFGFEAGLSDDLSGNVNTGFGYRALKATIGASLGYQNSAFGASALQANTTGYDNTALGRSTLGTATTAYFNTAVGSAAMVYTTNGSWNTGIGTFALLTNTTGSYNTGLGVQAMNDNLSGQWNTALGARVFENNSVGSYNTVVGGYAAQAAERLDNSVMIGYNARPANIFNDTNEIVIGYNAIGNGSNTTTIGNASTLKTYLKGKLNIGTLETPAVGAVTNIGIDTAGNIVEGSGGGGSIISGTANYISKFNTIGNNIEDSRIFDNGTNIGIGTVDFTDPAAIVVSGRVSQINTGNSTYFGFKAGQSDNTNDNGNTAFGSQALRDNVGIGANGIDNSAFGDQTLLVNTTGHTNTAIGKGALYANTSGYLNTAIGARALLFNTIGYWNTAVGANAMINNSSGRHNLAVGLQSLLANTTGIENTAIGTRSLEDITRTSSNIGIGYYVGKGRTGFSETILIGNSTIPLANSQTNQIVIGHASTGNGSNTTTIGNAATLKTFLKGKLNIGALESPAVGAVTNIGIDTSGNIVEAPASGGSVGAGIGLSKPASNILLGDNVTLFYTDTPTVKDFFLYQVGTNNLTALYSGFGVTTPTLGEAGFAATNSAGSRGAEIKAEYDSASPNPFAKIQINSGTGLFNVFSSDQTTGYRVRDDIHQRGLVEHADYSANKTDLSYTTIAWMKSRTNYNASVAQYFTHDASGVFAWVNI